MAAGAVFAWIALVALGGTPSLQDLTGRLDLTVSGSPRWLTALGVVPGGPPRERLLAVSLQGEMIAVVDGGESSVSLGRELDLRLLDPRSAIVLVHNHPHGASLSQNDLSQLEKPGVAAVVAIAHDGSVYAAARGALYAADRFDDLQYAIVREEVTKRARVACGSRELTVAAVDVHFSHVAALALAKAHVIEYQASLSAVVRASYESARIPFGRIAEGAAATLADARR
jgi:hypothetical protein